MVSAIRRARAAPSRTPRRHRGTFQDVVAMLVLGDVEALDGAVEAARGNDRDLARERHERFEDAGLSAERAPSGLGGSSSPIDGLALAVIAEAACLQHGGTPELRRAPRPISGADTRRKGGGADAEARRRKSSRRDDPG